MDEYLTLRQARRVWEVSTAMLFRWIDEGVLELKEDVAKPMIRLRDNPANSFVATRDGKRVSIELLRWQLAQELQSRREKHFYQQCLLVLPKAALLGIVSAAGFASGVGDILIGAICGGVVGACCFLVMMAWASWQSYRNKTSSTLGVASPDPTIKELIPSAVEASTLLCPAPARQAAAKQRPRRTLKLPPDCFIDETQLYEIPKFQRPRIVK
jgi:hypothetical protein